MFEKYTYVVKEKNEDPKQTVIEKGNISVSFTLADHEQSIVDMEKTLKELKAKYNHDKLIKENIEEHHPFVLKLTDLEKHTIYMYMEACEVVRQYEPKIAEFETAMETDKAEVAHVTKLIENA